MLFFVHLRYDPMLRSLLYFHSIKQPKLMLSLSFWTNIKWVIVIFAVVLRHWFDILAVGELPRHLRKNRSYFLSVKCDSMVAMAIYVLCWLRIELWCVVLTVLTILLNWRHWALDLLYYWCPILTTQFMSTPRWYFELYSTVDLSVAETTSWPFWEVAMLEVPCHPHSCFREKLLTESMFFTILKLALINRLFGL